MKKFFRRFLFWVGISLLFFIAYFVYVIDDAMSVSGGFRLPDYGAKKAALVVIDIQEGTTGKEAVEDFYIRQAPDLIQQTNKVISIAYQQNIPVIYIQQQTENWLLNWIDGYLMAPGAPGVALDSRLKVLSLNQFTKRKSDAFSSYHFEKYLQALEINQLIITGMDIAFCAGKTSYAAMNRGYEVYIVKEAVISENSTMKDEKIVELQEKGAKIITSAQLSEFLDQN